jgi:mono/diheme cytochrome c family protein
MRASPELAAAALAALVLVVSTAAEDAPITTLDGVFTAAQAKRGEAVYTGPCSRCHGFRLDGAPDDPDMLPAPPVAGAKFVRKWNGRSLAALVDYLRATMPENNPSYLSAAEYTDLVAYLLSVSGMPTGGAEMPADERALSRIVIAGPSSTRRDDDVRTARE